MLRYTSLLNKYVILGVLVNFYTSFSVKRNVLYYHQLNINNTHHAIKCFTAGKGILLNVFCTVEVIIIAPDKNVVKKLYLFHLRERICEKPETFSFLSKNPFCHHRLSLKRFLQILQQFSLNAFFWFVEL